MYTSFKVRNFRCLEKLTIDSLTRVNLIAGANNVGKTALIEALFIHAGAYNPQLSLAVDGLRGISGYKIDFGSSESPWDFLFPGLNSSNVVELEGDGRSLRLKVVRDPAARAGVAEHIDFGQYTKGEPQEFVSSLSAAKVLELEYSQGQRTGRYFLILDQTGARIEPACPPPPFPGYFIPARSLVKAEDLMERYSKLEQKGDHEDVLKALQIIEPRVTRLGLMYRANQVPALGGDIGFGLFPLELMGGGMVRLATITINMAEARGGVILIDEIENGLHHRVMPKVWGLICELSRRFETQVFATTHSWECIVAAQKAFAEAEPDAFRLHRLERVGDETRARTYAPETLAAAIDAGLEVR